MDMEAEGYRGRGSINITEINNLMMSDDTLVTTTANHTLDQNAYLNTSRWLIGAAVIFIKFTCFALIWQSRRKLFESTEYIPGTVEMKTSRWLSCKRFIDDATLSSSSNIIPLQLNISSDSGENLMINKAYNKEKWEIPKREFKFDSKILGSGNFSIVRKAFIWRFAHPTAVKVPKAGCSKEALKHFIYEIKVLSYIGEHENVLQFLGAFTEELHLGNVYIATEFCQNGSLLSRLRTLSSEVKPNENEELLIVELVRYSVEIARGMEYISGQNVIHGDLSARNILLSGNFTCKLSDFGLSRKIYQYGKKCISDQRTCLPWRWLATESLRRHEFSTKSDVWAYGVTLWEIFSLGEIPYPDMTWDAEFMNQLDSGFRLSCPKYAGFCHNSDVYSLMQECWKSDPECRPSFDTMINYFQGESSVEYLEL